METCAEISKMLSHAVDKICKGTDTANAFIDFMDGFVDAEEFMDYFMATWNPRIGNFLLTHPKIWECNLYAYIIWS